AAAGVQMAGQLIAGLAGKFDPATVDDTYAKEVRTLLDQALKGKKLKAPTPAAQPAAPADADDLLARLQQSINQAKQPAATPTRVSTRTRPARTPPSTSTATPARRCSARTTRSRSSGSSPASSPATTSTG